MLNLLYVQGVATAARLSPAARVAALREGVWSDAWVHVNEHDSLVHEASCAWVFRLVLEFCIQGFVK